MRNFCFAAKLRSFMLAAMPPSRAAPLTSSFSVSDENNVVVCPLRNHDSSACRKRCTGVSLHDSHPAPRQASKLATLNCRPTNTPCAGEALSVYARAHSTSSPGTLYFQASGDRGKICQGHEREKKNLATTYADSTCLRVGEFPVDGQYTTARTSTAPSRSSASSIANIRL